MIARKHSEGRIWDITHSSLSFITCTGAASLLDTRTVRLYNASKAPKTGRNHHSHRSLSFSCCRARTSISEIRLDTFLILSQHPSHLFQLFLRKKGLGPLPLHKIMVRKLKARNNSLTNQTSLLTILLILRIRQ